MNKHKPWIGNLAHLKPILFNKKQKDVIKMSDATVTYKWNLKDVRSIELGPVKHDIDTKLIYAKMIIIGFFIIIFSVFQLHHYRVHRHYVSNYPKAKSKPRML